MSLTLELVTEPQEGLFKEFDEIFLIKSKAGIVATVCLKRISFAPMDYYISLIPGPELKPRNIRQLYQMWFLTKDWAGSVAEIAHEDKRAQRFAEFFGLKYLGPSTEGMDFYGTRSSSI